MYLDALLERFATHGNAEAFILYYILRIEVEMRTKKDDYVNR